MTFTFINRLFRRTNCISGQFLHRVMGYFQSKADSRSSLYLKNPYNLYSYKCDPFKEMRSRLLLGEKFMKFEKVLAFTALFPILLLAKIFFILSKIYLSEKIHPRYFTWNIYPYSNKHAPTNFRVLRLVNASFENNQDRKKK